MLGEAAAGFHLRPSATGSTGAKRGERPGRGRGIAAAVGSGAWSMTQDKAGIAAHREALYEPSTWQLSPPLLSRLHLSRRFCAECVYQSGRSPC